MKLTFLFSFQNRIKHETNNEQAFETSSNGTTSIKSTNTTATIKTHTSNFSGIVPNNKDASNNDNKKIQQFFIR